MSPLEEWRRKKKRTLMSLAEALGVTESAVSRWCSGARMPRWGQINAIEELTGGAIRAAHWFGADARPTKRRRERRVARVSRAMPGGTA